MKFTIGDQICHEIKFDDKFCNDRLSGDMIFGIMARLFTANGFRDTQPIFVRFGDYLITAEEEKEQLVEPIIVVCISAGSLIILSFVVLLACISSRKRKQRLRKEKEAAEADENLLSFTSYCVIDKNPLPRKNYDD